MDMDFTEVERSALGPLCNLMGSGRWERVDLVAEKMFGPGSFGVFAFSDHALVGMARVFSDDLTTAWLADLCVHPECPDQGIGQELLDRMNARFRHTALYCDVRMEHVDLFTANGIRPKAKLTACHRTPAAGTTSSNDAHGITVYDDPQRYSVGDFDRVVDAVGFSVSGRGMPRERLYERLFGEGIQGAFAEDAEGHLIAFARVLTDNRTKSYVAEICVHPDWQRKGVGHAVLGRIVNRFSHTEIYTEAFPEPSAFSGNVEWFPIRDWLDAAVRRSMHEIAERSSP